MKKEHKKSKHWHASHNVTYVLSDKAFRDKVLELRKKYPNDQEFGGAVASLI
jgi:hypothetical protein